MLRAHQTVLYLRIWSSHKCHHREYNTSPSGMFQNYGFIQRLLKMWRLIIQFIDPDCHGCRTWPWWLTLVPTGQGHSHGRVICCDEVFVDEILPERGTVPLHIGTMNIADQTCSDGYDSTVKPILKTTCVKRLPFQGSKTAILTVIHMC